MCPWTFYYNHEIILKQLTYENYQVDGLFIAYLLSTYYNNCIVKITTLTFIEFCQWCGSGSAFIWVRGSESRGIKWREKQWVVGVFSQEIIFFKHEPKTVAILDLGTELKIFFSSLLLKDGYTLLMILFTWIRIRIH